jgi:hypothetical protein
VESGGISPPLLTSALNGDEWSGLSPCCFDPKVRHFITKLLFNFLSPEKNYKTTFFGYWLLLSETTAIEVKHLPDMKWYSKICKLVEY